jgi:signal peptidase I
MTSVNVFSNEIMPLVKELLDQDQHVLLTVSGTSMRPFFKHQKTVVKLGKINEHLKKYDVVLYQHKGHYKLHRFIRIKKGNCIINGDGLKEMEVVERRHLFGYVLSHQVKDKWIKNRSFIYLLKVSIWSLLRPFRSIMLRLYRG